MNWLQEAVLEKARADPALTPLVAECIPRPQPPRGGLECNWRPEKSLYGTIWEEESVEDTVAFFLVWRIDDGLSKDGVKHTAPE